MLTDFPIEAILDRLVERIVDVLPVTSAGVTLISDDGDAHHVAASDRSALEFVELQSTCGEGPCLAAYRTGEPVLVADLGEDTSFPRFTPHAIAGGLAAVFTFPLHHGDACLGALDLYRNTPGPLGRAAMDAAETLADVTAAYILNARTRIDLLEAADRSRMLSMHDALTGMPNRVLFLERLGHAIDRGARSVKVGVSVGVAGSAPGGVPSVQLLERADRAMYQAKRSGGGRRSIGASEVAAVPLHHERQGEASQPG